MFLIFGGRVMRYIAVITAVFVVPLTTLITKANSPVSEIYNEEQQLRAEVDTPSEAMLIGTVDLPRQANADGVPLDPGRYELHLTSPSTTPHVNDVSHSRDHWIEFRQEDGVKGREMVTIVSGTEIITFAESTPPSSGSARIEVLKENDYLRIWLNNDGIHYLIHLAIR